MAARTVRVLAYGCEHAPFTPERHIRWLLERIAEWKPDIVVHLGDRFEAVGGTVHDSNEFDHDQRDEYEAAAATSERVRKACPDTTQFVWVLGNHDERYQHYLWQKLGELNGVEDFELENLIKKRVTGIKFITDKRIIKANDLNIVHGHEFASSIISPVNIARGLYFRAKANTICGHHHRSSEHTEQNIEGKIVTTWSVGCLSELHPQYMPINSWNHGFCMVDLHGSKEFEVRNKRIWKGQIL